MNQTVIARLKRLEERMKNSDELLPIIVFCIPDDMWYPDCGLPKQSEVEGREGQILIVNDLPEDDGIDDDEPK